MAKTTTAKTPSDLIGLEEVLQLTGLTASGWREVRRRGKSENVRRWKNGKNVLFSRAEIEAWTAARTQPVA